ncbi:MAG: hypothetical protein H3C30_10730 [Candidatus Hydrogenedentes bacterium]|nr:hypothetical protein [Candidatus Hydrogenedentota bacterium]
MRTSVILWTPALDKIIALQATPVISATLARIRTSVVTVILAQLMIPVQARILVRKIPAQLMIPVRARIPVRKITVQLMMPAQFLTIVQMKILVLSMTIAVPQTIVNPIHVETIVVARL